MPPFSEKGPHVFQPPLGFFGSAYQDKLVTMERLFPEGTVKARKWENWMFQTPLGPGCFKTPEKMRVWGWGCVILRSCLPESWW